MFAFFLLVSGCGNHSTSVTQITSGTTDQSSNQNQTPPVSGAPVLALSETGETPHHNVFQATNVSSGLFTSDFTFTADQDEKLILDLNSIKFTLLGCDTSDIGVQINLHPTHSDGSIDLSAYQSLGPAPILINKSAQYVARVNLILKKSCLGLSLRFDIIAAPFSP